jgi:hypothetical protein
VYAKARPTHLTGGRVMRVQVSTPVRAMEMALKARAWGSSVLKTRVHECTHTHTRTHAHIHTHARTHTHTRASGTSSTHC